MDGSAKIPEKDDPHPVSQLLTGVTDGPAHIGHEIASPQYTVERKRLELFNFCTCVYQEQVVIYGFQTVPEPCKLE